MTKGILILIGTIIVVGILNFVVIKMMKVPESKKSYYRKLFWYFYGVFFMLSGGVNLIENEGLDWIFSIQFLIGIIIIILNFLGKLTSPANYRN